MRLRYREAVELSKVVEKRQRVERSFWAGLHDKQLADGHDGVRGRPHGRREQSMERMKQRRRERRGG